MRLKLSPYSPLSSFFHFLHGLLSGIVYNIDPYLSVFLFVLFFLYELVEYVKIRDTMYFELREWIAGYTIGIIIVWGKTIFYILLVAWS